MPYSTWEDEPCHLVWWRDQLDPPEHPVLDAYARLLAVAGEEAQFTGPVLWRDEAIPTPEACDLLRTTGADESSFAKLAKSTLPKASKFYKPVFDLATPFVAADSHRYTTMLSCVGWLCRHLTPLDGVLPEHIFALVQRQIEQWGEDESSGRLYVEIAWEQIQHFFSIEEAQVRASALEAQVAARDAATIIAGMVAGVAEWFPDIERMQPKEQRSWLLRHLIVSAGAVLHYFVMDTNGHYGPMGVAAQQLVPYMIQLGLHRVIPMKNDEGKFKTSTDLVNAYSSNVLGIRYEAGETHSRIEFVDTFKATLCFGVYKRSAALPAEWSDDVDEWLRAFAGARYETLCEWIGHAVAFEDGALPMLSIVGPPDCGKKLLVQGLAETLVDPATADGEALFGDWHEALLTSPFVWIDEGWSLAGLKHPADRLREVIGSPELKLKMKFKAPARLKANLRLVITSNSMETLARLGLGKELDEYAQRALADRIIHITVPSNAPAYLKDRGGMRYTKGWIKGDSTGNKGAPSRYVIAKHFMKLHEITVDMRLNQTTRYLMSGLDKNAYDEKVMAELKTSSLSANSAIMALFYMLETVGTNPAKQDKFVGLYVNNKDRLIFVLAGAVLKHMKHDTDNFSSKEIPSIKALGKALDNLSKPLPDTFDRSELRLCTDERYVLLSRKAIGPQRWKVLDTALLLELSRKWGYPVPLLEQIAGDGAEVIEFPQAATREEGVA